MSERGPTCKGKHDYSTDADSWLQWADHTYKGARTLFNSGDFLLWFPAAILGHHALEMYLKAALMRKGHRAVKGDVWGHDLITLFNKLVMKVPALPNDLPRKLAVFNDYFDELRYPQVLLKVEGLGEDEGRLLDDLVRVTCPPKTSPVKT